MQTLIRDIRYASRQLRNSPGFTLTVVLALALGIGATTAIFSLIEAILLRPLPFADPDKLVMLGDRIGNIKLLPVTAREIATYTNATTAFSSVGGFATAGYELSGGETPERIDGARLNASVFPTLGVQPILGRAFTAQEEDAHQLLAVISYRLWLNRFHRDPGVIGTSITLDRKTYTVIGVMPRNFDFPIEHGLLHPTALWVPLSLTADELSDQQAGAWGLHLVARLKNGVTLRQGAEDADRVSRLIMQNFPARLSAIHIQGDVRSMREFYVADARPLLRTLLLAVTAVLLIACVNVASLMLVRSIRRRREYAVRLALGARSRAIVRESVLEGVLLSGAGGVIGLLFVFLAVRSAPHLLPDSMPRVDSIAVNPAVAAFAVLLALATGVFCSLAPAFAALRTNLTEGLKEGSRNLSGTSSHAWLRSTLVVVEIAIALVLVNSSAALIRSYEKMLAVDPGFRPDHVLVAGFRLPLWQYSTATSSAEFNRAVLEKLSAKPGITSVGIGSTLPASGLIGGAGYTIEGEPVSQWKLKFAMFALIDGDYFKALGIRVLDGRAFTSSDQVDTQQVIIVNESMAKHGWPGQNAIGKRIHLGNPNSKLPWATVVGIVADTKGGARDEPAEDEVYLSLRQPAAFYGNDYQEKLASSAGGFIVLRSVLPPAQMTETLRSTVVQIDPHLALERIQTMDQVMAGVEAPRRFNTGLIGGFATVALVLAITGIYAVVAFSVSMRAQEIAIRMALGAQRVNIARLVLTSGAKLGLAGCALGILGSLATAQLIKSFLFGVSAIDPIIYTAGVGLILAFVVLASALPASRAASADPTEALRAA